MISRKRILIFIDWFVPGYKAGGPISSNANLIDHLSEKFEFYVITRNTDYMESKPYTQVVSNQWNTINNGAKVYYISADRLTFRTLISVARQVSFDAVFVNGIYSLYFSLFPVIWFGKFRSNKVVVSARGMLSDHTFSAKRLKKKIFYFVARIMNLYRGVIIHATNAEEERQIRKNLKFRGIIRIAPNLPLYNKNLVLTALTKTSRELRLVSIARISPEKNTLFALEILEQFVLHTVKNSEKEGYSIIFDLYGPVYQDDYGAQCMALAKRLPAQITVNFCGSIEKDSVSAVLQKYHFLFMPSQGENYGHSIVESFIAGRPVIISDRTPWRNLNSRFANEKSNIVNQKSIFVGWDIPLDEPGRFVEVVEYCTAMGQEEYDTISNEAYQFGRQISTDKEVLEANRRLFD